jgi:hypothetical protein
MIPISDELIRQRSYEIWLRDGCPHGLATRHWFEAQAELQAERYTALLPSPDFDFRRVVLPRPSISRLPRRLLADRIASNRTGA